MKSVDVFVPDEEAAKPQSDTLDQQIAKLNRRLVELDESDEDADRQYFMANDYKLGQIRTQNAYERSAVKQQIRNLRSQRTADQSTTIRGGGYFYGSNG